MGEAPLPAPPPCYTRPLCGDKCRRPNDVQFAMPQFDELLLTYLQLAHASQRRRQLQVRDKLLVLAGMTALEIDREDISAHCRRRVLEHNPRHLVRRWPDLATAARAERFRAYLKQLRRKYSPEKAEHMLDSLGISPDDMPSAGSGNLLRSRGEESRTEWASLLAEFMAPADDERQAAAFAGPQVADGQLGSMEARSMGRPRAENAWWPFWLGVGITALLGLLRVFGRG